MKYSYSYSYLSIEHMCLYCYSGYLYCYSGYLYFDSDSEARWSTGDEAFSSTGDEVRSSTARAHARTRSSMRVRPCHVTGTGLGDEILGIIRFSLINF